MAGGSGRRRSGLSVCAPAIVRESSGAGLGAILISFAGRKAPGDLNVPRPMAEQFGVAAGKCALNERQAIGDAQLEPN